MRWYPHRADADAALSFYPTFARIRESCGPFFCQNQLLGFQGARYVPCGQVFLSQVVYFELFAIRIVIEGLCTQFPFPSFPFGVYCSFEFA